jgi:cytoskeleton protein RodZ
MLMADSEQSSEPKAPPPPPPPPPPATLGERLRAARLRQDLTVEQISTELRIEAKQLHALEENRFEQIGVPVFVKGYLKQYGTRLGLDVGDLLALYYKQTTLADVQVQPSRTIALRNERQITSWVLAAIVLLTVIVGLAAWWWNGGSFGAMLPTGSTAAPAPASAPESTPTRAEPAPTRAEPEPERTAPVPEQRSVPVEDAAPAAEPAASDARPPETAAVTQAPDETDDARAGPAVTIPLDLVFDAESWAEITDARGERLLFGLSSAGRNVTVRGEPPFSLVLGNADVVRLTVDGAPYTIPRTGRQGNLARFSVDLAEE